MRVVVMGTDFGRATDSISEGMFMSQWAEVKLLGLGIERRFGFGGGFL